MNRNFVIWIQLILAYEWLVSGFNKILGGNFISNFHQQCLASIPHMQYGFYAELMKQYCLPHCTLMASLVETGELATGLGFIFLSLLLWRRPKTPILLKLGPIVSLVGAFMTLNFFFYQGGSIFINPSDPFDEGISLDLLMVLIQVAVAAFYLGSLGCIAATCLFRIEGCLPTLDIPSSGYPFTSPHAFNTFTCYISSRQRSGYRVCVQWIMAPSSVIRRRWRSRIKRGYTNR